MLNAGCAYLFSLKNKANLINDMYRPNCQGFKNEVFLIFYFDSITDITFILTPQNTKKLFNAISILDAFNGKKIKLGKFRKIMQF